MLNSKVTIEKHDGTRMLNIEAMSQVALFDLAMYNEHKMNVAWKELFNAKYRKIDGRWKMIIRLLISQQGILKMMMGSICFRHKSLWKLDSHGDKR